MKTRRAESGYNFVVLVMAIAVLNILAAASLPLWSHVIRREKEEELIFRGFQYAEAIRVYKIRFGGQPPTRLAELIEREPRAIRQLWKDPMTEDGKWRVIFQNQGRQLTIPDPNNPSNPNKPNDPNGRDPGEEERDPEEEESTFGKPKEEEVQIGPISGVRSRSRDASILIFYGRERYDEWEFTDQRIMEVMAGGRVGGQGFAAPTGAPPSMSIRWAGRPLPRFLQPEGMPQDGTLPDGSRINNPGNPGFGGGGRTGTGLRRPPSPSRD